MSNNDLKNSWKNTGIELGHAFRDLGKILVKTGTSAVKKADEWASDNGQKNVQNTAQNNQAAQNNQETEQKESNKQE